MMHKPIVLICGAVLAGSLLGGVGASPAQALHPGGDVYRSEHYNVPYKFKDDECKGLPFKVQGRARGFEVIYNVPGSHGQAFLDDNRNRTREVWTNPANGRQAFVRGKSRFRELEAHHVKGDIWRFRSVTSGAPFVVKNDKRRVVLAEWGALTLDTTYDTLGDSQPGGDILKDAVVRKQGHWPTWEPDFDFCDLVHKVLD
jgi:hypothetical protein